MEDQQHDKQLRENYSDNYEEEVKEDDGVIGTERVSDAENLGKTPADTTVDEILSLDQQTAGTPVLPNKDKSLELVKSVAIDDETEQKAETTTTGVAG